MSLVNEAWVKKLRIIWVRAKQVRLSPVSSFICQTFTSIRYRDTVFLAFILEPNYLEAFSKYFLTNIYLFLTSCLGPRKQDFWPKNIFKGNNFNLWIQWLTVHQKMSKSVIESEFSMSRINLIFFQCTIIV